MPVELLPDDEFHRYTMMEHEDFDKLPKEIQERFDATYSFHFQQRMNDLDPESIVTEDGRTYRQVIEDARRKKGG